VRLVSPSKHERQTRADFSARYSVSPSRLLDDIERRVLGGSWGANGFTTVSQADHLGAALRLAAGKRLLDIGTGRGWPGLYLAARSGCDVALADLPIEGIQIALRRAAEEEVVRCLGGVVSSAGYLPFAAGSFDAAVHTDVLC
jgi:SAM-dependent methyltransferase